MERILAMYLLLGFVIVVLFGVGLTAVGCNGSMMHHVFAMANCPQAFAALLHHVGAFLAVFAAILIAIPFSLRVRYWLMHDDVAVESTSLRIHKFAGPRIDAVIVHLPHQLFRRGILHRKDAPFLMC